MTEKRVLVALGLKNAAGGGHLGGTELDAHVEEFRTRRLDDAGPVTFVAADALVLKVREGAAWSGCMRS